MVGRDVEVIDWPLKHEQVTLMILNCEELQESYFAARKHFKIKGQEIDDCATEQLELEEMLQQCYRMLLQPGAEIAEARVFENPVKARKALTADEREYFCVMHNRIQAKKWAALRKEEKAE